MTIPLMLLSSLATLSRLVIVARLRIVLQIWTIIIIIKAIYSAQDPLKKAANALSGSEKM